MEVIVPIIIAPAIAALVFAVAFGAQSYPLGGMGRYLRAGRRYPSVDS
jgi:hypothetical protein